MSLPANQPEVLTRGNRAVAITGGVLAAVLLTLIFWYPLWTGGGLVGSDIYAYYLPQKAYYAERLRAGELPLWNNLVGNGYPQVAESQTGVFYPLHLLLYPLLELNTAYSASVIVHYVLAFVLTAIYARRIGLSNTGALLAALVYTYGWFPARVCNEWAIVGGAWLPLALWCAESFLQSRFWRHALGLTATLAVQMLAGHFVLAFITQLTLAAYVPLRLWFSAGDLPPATRNSRGRMCLGLTLTAVAAFLLAAVQLLPTWELKQLSQRVGVSREHDPAYGSIPVRYLSQIALPWMWYPDESSFETAGAPGGPRTNRVEAHLYFGLIPLALVLWRVWRWRTNGDRRMVVWTILGLAALVYATGCLVPVTAHLPGFSFFEGPGRYGIVTTLAAGLLAGSGFADAGALVRRLCRSSRTRPFVLRVVVSLLAAIVLGGTTADLHVVSRLVTYAELVKDPPANHIAESPLRHVLNGLPSPARIFSEAKNLPSLVGVAAVPPYLGLGPAQYFDPEFMIPEPIPYAVPPTREQLDWFHRAGVTHFLSFRPIDRAAWSARLVWEGVDQFLNSALARQNGDRMYLYELEGSRGRTAFLDPKAGSFAKIADVRANQDLIETDSAAVGRLVLTDLAYPGWFVDVDGKAAEPVVVEGMFRGVDLSAG
ncbi:MAG: hypothetical protein ACM3U2_07305, partial [Deltaproteobacteria bacterium]